MFLFIPQKFQRVHTRETYAVAHLGDQFDTIDQFTVIISRVDLPGTGLILAADDPAVENAGAVYPVEEKSRKANVDLRKIFLMGKYFLLLLT